MGILQEQEEVPRDPRGDVNQIPKQNQELLKKSKNKREHSSQYLNTHSLMLPLPKPSHPRPHAPTPIPAIPYSQEAQMRMHLHPLQQTPSNLYRGSRPTNQCHSLRWKGTRCQTPSPNLPNHPRHRNPNPSQDNLELKLRETHMLEDSRTSSLASRGGWGWGGVVLV